MVRVLITAGSTREHIDPVRYISSSSSGKQGYALAECMGKIGWDVNLVSCSLGISPNSQLYQVFNVVSAAQMLDKSLSLLPVDIAILTAAVTDWVPHYHDSKLKKHSKNSIELLHSPDIAKCLGTAPNRPKLVIGFCLESYNLLDAARHKLEYKECDWIIANPHYVKENEPVMGSDYNKISIVRKDSVRNYELMTKVEAARVIVEEIIDYLKVEDLL
ncbi:phosphopantothenoylcysteine decarboxylase [Anaplasma platys]|uniref:Phosphopantothenoylcysteine decarboxylase n=1 Tax=Anaplasma platys TaxID=949 RepID=A0A858PXK1_9RICK|nr:phosphopantothenoylcysteine decarboxylase [Anaplasma platys]QJC27326.1 phosphopantothenoylcysteine decarboxylase [Anaplasma platys]